MEINTYNASVDMDLLSECLQSFYISTGLPTSFADENGRFLLSFGRDCTQCQLCSYVTGANHQTDCVNTHLYGMAQAQRFGGKYIYFCPGGLNFIVSPVLSQQERLYAKAGPFLMVDSDDFIRYDMVDLLKIPQEDIDSIAPFIETIPYVEPAKVDKLATLFFMSVGFVNNINLYNEMLKSREASEIQGFIGEFVKTFKDESVEGLSYPFDKEEMLLEAIQDGDKARSSELLNDILGYIFFYAGANFEIIKTRVLELLVMLSRAAVQGGADPNQIFGMNFKYINEINSFASIDDLCVWLAEIMNRFTDNVFKFNNVKHVDVIRKAVDYVRRNYAKKITLEEVASYVYLSPSYFSKVFKDEMHCNFNSYLNRLRIEKSKQLLLSENVRLVEVSGLVGFEDQSYFSKVFKKLTGVSPGKFRESRGKTGK